MINFYNEPRIQRQDRLVARAIDGCSNGSGSEVLQNRPVKHRSNGRKIMLGRIIRLDPQSYHVRTLLARKL